MLPTPIESSRCGMREKQPDSRRWMVALATTYKTISTSLSDVETTTCSAAKLLSQFCRLWPSNSAWRERRDNSLRIMSKMRYVEEKEEGEDMEINDNLEEDGQDEFVQPVLETSQKMNGKVVDLTSHIASIDIRST